MLHFPIKNGDFPVRKLLVYQRLCLPSLQGARQAIQGPSQALQLRVLHGLGAAPRGELNVEPERNRVWLILKRDVYINNDFNEVAVRWLYFAQITGI